MTIYGVVAAAIARKVRNLIAEYRKLIAEATATEKQIVGAAEAEVVRIRTTAQNETAKLRNELIDRIAAL